MKIKLILLSLLISCSLVAQKTKKIKVKNKKEDSIEIYYVLKSDKTIKQGTYSKYNNLNNLILEGEYSDNYKSGLWEIYSNDGILKMKGAYEKCLKTGIWDYFNAENKIIQKFDFSNKKLTFFEEFEFEEDDFEIVSKDNVANLNLERPPLYLGGKISILKNIYTNISYPNIARENGIQGTVEIRFTVNKDGKLSNYTILKNVAGGCSEEALRMVKILNDGFWIPGIANGKLVSTTYTIPIRFKLN
jgi:TonB family protein